MKKILCVLLALAMCLSFAACNKTNPENSVLRIGAASDWTTEGMNLVFDTLTYRISSTEATKQLIEVIPNADFTEYTLKVTQGVKFSDGTVFDAECVKYAIEKEALATTLGFHTLMTSLEVKDSATLVAKFPSPYATFEYELSYILAVKVGAVSPEGNITEYIGTGMYALDEFDAGTTAKFSYNKTYWQADTKKPTVTKVEYKVIPDIPTRVMALENKEIDVIGISEHGGMADYVTLDQLKGVDGVQIDLRATANPSMYMFNYTKGPTMDLALRKAISLAVDRENLVKSVCYGLGTPAYTYIMDGEQYCPTDKSLQFKFDVEEAKKILKDAGYVDTNGNGILEKDGKDIVLSLVTLSSETYRNTAVLVKDDLKKIGIGVEVSALDAAGYYAKSQVGDFDMCFTHPWKEAVTYYTWRCIYSDYDTMGTGFGFDPKFNDYFDVVSANVDKVAIQKFFDMFWAESYDFIPALTLYSGATSRVYTDEVSGFIWSRGHGTLHLIDLSEVVVDRK